jgi:hypothetical protein
MQLFYLANGLLTLPEATTFAIQFQDQTRASDQRTMDLAQTLLTSTIDLQYHLIADRLFSILRLWFIYPDTAKASEYYPWVTKALAWRIRNAETQKERIKIWTPLLEKETFAWIWWMQVFSSSLNSTWIFPAVEIMDRDESKLRKRLQRYFTMKFILMVDVVLVKLIKPILNGKLRDHHTTVENLFNQDVSISLLKWGMVKMC